MLCTYYALVAFAIISAARGADTWVSTRAQHEVIASLELFPTNVLHTITEYLKHSSNFLIDPRYAKIKGKFPWTVNDHGDIIMQTQKAIIVWNYLNNVYLSSIPLGKDLGVDRIAAGRVVLVERDKKKNNYILRIRSGLQLQDTVTHPFSDYPKNIFEISDDGDYICSAENPLIKNTTIRRITCTRLKAGIMKRIEIGQNGCMPPLTISRGGQYVGAYDHRTGVFIVCKAFDESDSPPIVRIPTMSLSGHYLSAATMMLRKGLQNKELYSVSIQEARKSNEPLKMKKLFLSQQDSSAQMYQWMCSNGEVLIGSKIIACPGKDVVVRTLTTKTETDQSDNKSYYLMSTTFNVSKNKEESSIALPLDTCYSGVQALQTDSNVLYAIPDPEPNKFFMYDGSSSVCLPTIEGSKLAGFALSPNGQIGVVGGQLIMMRGLGMIKEPQMRAGCTCNPACFNGLTLPESLVNLFKLGSLCKKKSERTTSLLKQK